MDSDAQGNEAENREKPNVQGLAESSAPELWSHHADTIYLLDENGIVLKQGEMAEQFLNVPAISRVGMQFVDDPLVHPDDRTRYREFAEALVRMPVGTVTARYRRRQRDESYRELEVTGRQWRTEPNKVVLIVICRDVTDEARGDAARARLAAIVDSSDAAIISKSLDGIVTSWNRAAENLLGYSAREMIGTSILRLIPEERHDEELEIIRRIRNGERIHNFDTVRLDKRGRRIDVSLIISPIRDESGQIVGASKILYDVTERKKLIGDLAAARDAAEAASRAKDHFLAVLSHELRTPLTPALASLTYLEEIPELSAEVRHEIATIRRNVELEARLIDDLLDLTHIAHGKFAINRTVLDLHVAIRTAISVCQPEIDGKQHELAVALRASRHTIHGDSARLQQVFWNLIRNAVKFTPPEGQIRVKTFNTEDDNIVVEVSDTGPGVPEDLRPRIFNAFEQGEQVAGRNRTGMGLGLTIAKLLVNAHDGEIRVVDRPSDQGAAFQVELRTISTGGAPTLRRPTPRNRPEPIKLLLVEDNLDSLRAFTRVLTWNGFEVRTATSVAEALEVCQRESFDLVISDIGLPDGSGHDVMRQLRELKGMRGIACSGFGGEDDVEASLNAGFVQHLVKPVSLTTLLDAIQAAID